MSKWLALAVFALVYMLAMTPSTMHAEPATSAFDHEFEAIEGGKLPLSKWRGRVLFVVNTASFCGFTRQYEGLQKLWERYEKQGLVVVGVPSNDFGWQEPKSEKEILSFCQGAFNVTFPLTNKQSVRGSSAHPFYRWARETLGSSATPQWNFYKYLVGRDGKLIAGYGSTIEPLSKEMITAIESALAKR